MRSENLVKMAELKNTEKLEKFNRHKGKIKIGILGVLGRGSCFHL